MADDITQKHLNRARVRGAPATIAGAAGMVQSYAYDEVRMNTMRALAVDLPVDWSVAQLTEGQQKLAQAAATQGLTVLEPALLALLADPMENPPHEWEWQLQLPVRGRARADEAAGIHITRVHGGMYIESHTTRGTGDLPNLYTFFLGHLLPTRKQQLVRPVIYHRVTDGLASSADPGQQLQRLGIEVFIPFFLSLKTQPRLLTREEI